MIRSFAFPVVHIEMHIFIHDFTAIDPLIASLTLAQYLDNTNWSNDNSDRRFGKSVIRNFYVIWVQRECKIVIVFRLHKMQKNEYTLATNRRNSSNAKTRKKTLFWIQPLTYAMLMMSSDEFSFNWFTKKIRVFVIRIPNKHLEIPIRISNEINLWFQALSILIKRADWIQCHPQTKGGFVSLKWIKKWKIWSTVIFRTIWRWLRNSITNHQTKSRLYSMCTITSSPIQANTISVFFKVENRCKNMIWRPVEFMPKN